MNSYVVMNMIGYIDFRWTNQTSVVLKIPHPTESADPFGISFDTTKSPQWAMASCYQCPVVLRAQLLNIPSSGMGAQLLL